MTLASARQAEPVRSRIAAYGKSAPEADAEYARHSCAQDTQRPAAVFDAGLRSVVTGRDEIQLTGTLIADSALRALNVASLWRRTDYLLCICDGRRLFDGLAFILGGRCMSFW